MAESKWVEPDVRFVKELKALGGDTLKKCFQCATCSVVCPISPEEQPFPRKEMIAAQWVEGQACRQPGCLALPSV